MVFCSTVFLWLFLPIVYIGSCLIKPKYANILLVIASLVFYAGGGLVYVPLILVPIIVNWLIGLGIQRFRSKYILFIGLLFNLGLLGYYKYTAFFIETINLSLKKEILPVPDIVLPIGISFFTFQAISYIVDVYKGKVDPQRNLFHIALYISFFPQLIAGPIVKYKEISAQIENRTITLEKTAIGFRKFIYGLSKKVLIANVLGFCADKIYGYDMSDINGMMAWVASLAYTFQIYYDFSGYSDMAIGLGKMFGFDIPSNFNYPYLSKSISEFWRRWHITLGAWFREYVYIPLGGNRSGEARTRLNLFLVFLLTGLWHGASFSFVFWGIYHGFFVLMERTDRLKKYLDKFPILGMIYSFAVVHFGWIFFRVDGIKKAMAFIKRMLLPQNYLGIGLEVWEYIDLKVLFIGICAVLGCGILQRAIPVKLAERWKESVCESLFLVVLLVLCLIAVAGDTYNPFIYYQF